MSDSGRDWGASFDESIRALNAAKRDAKIENAIKQLDSLHAATIQYGDWKIDDYAWPHEIAICDNDCIVLATVTNKNSNNAALQREQQECSVGFTIAAHNVWPTISDELKRLRAENSELEGWKRSAIETFARWDKCHVAAGSPAKPGEYTSEATEREILRLRDMNQMLVGALKVASADCDQLREELKGKV